MGEKLLKIKCKVADTLINLTNKLSLALPMKNYIAFESNPDFSDNTGALYEEMISEGLNEKYNFFWMLNDSKSHDLPKNVFEIQHDFIACLKKTWVLGRAKFIIDCNVYLHKTREDQTRVHLKHGLPIKDASNYTKKCGSVDLITVPSEQWIDICAKEHNVPNNIVKPLGFPRNDILSLKKHDKISIIWMPTYRTHKLLKDNRFEKFSVFGVPCIENSNDFLELNDILVKNNVMLYIGFHPVQKLDNIKFENLSNITLCDDCYLNSRNLKLYEFLCETDALISDYSSIYFDYLLLNNPIALSLGDFDEYSKYNGLIYKTLKEFKEAFPAVYLDNFEDLKQFIKNVADHNNEIAEPVKRANEKYNMGQVKNSSKTIIKYLKENCNL